MSQDNWVELGRTGGAYGVRGWIRAVPVESGEVLLKAKEWSVVHQDGTRTIHTVTSARRHSDIIIAKFADIEQKEDADKLRGTIYVRRELFPEAGKDEVWAVDVVGAQVINAQGQHLGEVEAIGSNGVQDLLEIRWTTEEGKTARFMIPMVKDVFLLDIDTDKKQVTVDFDADWR